MAKIMVALLYIGGPMAFVQFLYRLIDHKGKKTAILVEKFPILKRRKFIIQILVPMLFLVIFGMISVLCHIPLKVFFIVCGAFIGLINGLAVTIMYCCES